MKLQQKHSTAAVQEVRAARGRGQGHGGYRGDPCGDYHGGPHGGYRGGQ